MELIVVLVLALVVLGPKRLPDAGRSLGKGLREFKGAIAGSSDDELDTSAFPAERQKAMQAQPQTPAVAAAAPVEQPTV
jgi:sec-independent protein translocase protein TatA